MASGARTASIIVPTYREAPNIEELVRRIFAATRAANIEAELILVDDDSRDGTEGIVESLRGQYPVRLLVRRAERGLARAVVAGFAEARFDRLVVLDADLQHPPEAIPQLLAGLDDPGCDFVMATRYSRRGSVAAGWPWYRRLASRLATALARPLAPLTDPMSGCFALKTEAWKRAASRVDPIGYKIGLELCVKCGCRQPAEVPISFGTRAAGSSKLGWSAQTAYLRHLLRLYRFRFPRGMWVARSLAITVVALFVLLFACRKS